MRFIGWSEVVCLSYTEAYFLEVGGRENGLGLAKGDYRIDRVFDNGKVDLRDMRGKKHRVEPIKIEPTGKLNRLKLSNEKRIEVHEGERIRWTDSGIGRASGRERVCEYV